MEHTTDAAAAAHGPNRATKLKAGRRSLLTVVVLAVVGAMVAVLPTAPAYGAGGLSATFTPAADWGSGHQVTVTVRNAGTTAVSTWAVEFDLPAGTTVSSWWDTDITRSGTNRYKATPKSWAGPLQPGATQSFGYLASGAYRAPSSCTLNGASCEADGSTPSPTTTRTVPPSPTTTVPTKTVTPTATTTTTRTVPPSPTTTVPTKTVTPTATTTTTTNPNPGAKKVVGYFTQWGVYGRNYHVKNIQTSGSASKLTHIVYAFGNTTGGKCTIGDSYADYDKAYTAADSVDGVADTWDQPLRGNFNQLRKLKKANPNLKVLWSFGGWTWSAGFTQAAANPTAFADSCYALVEDPRWADVFDGIDVDWEYPNACGLTCDTSGPQAFTKVVTALRTKFGTSNLVTAAITADGSEGGKIDATDYASGTQKLDWLMPMTYDYFGAWDAKGPTNPHSPLTSYPGIPKDGYNSEAAVDKLIAKGVPASKMLLGVGFYGRGWTGVTQATPGGTATGAAPGTYEAGIEDYKVLKTKCPATGTIAGTAYAKCGSEWWSYDTPATLTSKMAWTKNKGLGGTFFWELSGDTTNGELISALSNGLR